MFVPESWQVTKFSRVYPLISWQTSFSDSDYYKITCIVGLRTYTSHEFDYVQLEGVYKIVFLEEMKSDVKQSPPCKNKRKQLNTNNVQLHNTYGYIVRCKLTHINPGMNINSY